MKDLYNTSSKSPMITKLKIEKMKRRVDKVKNEVHKDQQYLTRDVDIMKLYMKNNNPKNTQNDKRP